MADTEETCSRGEALGLERVRYFPRQLLTADDMRAEQEYARQRQRRFNRFVIGWGVVCGFEVEYAPPDTPAGVLVHPGYALSPWGDEIYVPEVVRVAFGRRLTEPADPCKPATTTPGSSTTKKIYVAIRYHECPTRPVRTSPAGCGCDETACEYSRLRDGAQIELLRCLPGSHVQVAEATLCTMANTKDAKVIPCPPYPKDAWVVLATLTFETGTGEPPITGNTFVIDYAARRLLVSSARTQAQLLRLCSLDA